MVLTVILWPMSEEGQEKNSRAAHHDHERSANNMKKYIIREVPAEQSDFSYYFDGDCFNERSGDYNNTLFIVQNEGYNRLNGYNIDEYKNVQERAEAIINGFEEVREGITDYDGKKVTFKAVMEENGIHYNPTTCRRLKVWSEDADSTDTADIADFF